MLSKVFASALIGVDAQAINIEVHVGKGAKRYMVGLPDNAIKESWHRVEISIRSQGLHMPRQKIVVNLSPADLRKEGSAFDLPIACGVLAASGQLLGSDCLEDFMLMGELSLDGQLQAIKGALPTALLAKQMGLKGLILPACNAEEAGMVEGIDIYPAKDLAEVFNFFLGYPSLKKQELQSLQTKTFPAQTLDFSDVRGQENIKRALEIAASGGHNLILIGPPAAGKTMLAKRLPGILPPLEVAEALETTKIHSVAGKLSRKEAIVYARPFRAPHHTVSDVALVGGGNNPQPGEISLAHNGVLFLDELPEFKRSVLEVLRQPMEERRITISRARFTVDYPANFMLVASMNPCPCGFFNHPDKECVCSGESVQRYLNKISGPLLDRIDLHVEVTPVALKLLSEKNNSSEKSDVVRERVESARTLQRQRFVDDDHIFSNAQMSSKMIREHCKIKTEGASILNTAMEKLGLSARAYDRILKVARTIADLENSETIETAHLAEAIQFRTLDRSGWGL